MNAWIDPGYPDGDKIRNRGKCAVSMTIFEYQSYIVKVYWIN